MPVKPESGVYVKPPSAASDSVPLAGPATSDAVKASPCASASLASTPKAAATVRAAFGWTP